MPEVAMRVRIEAISLLLGPLLRKLSFPFPGDGDYFYYCRIATDYCHPVALLFALVLLAFTESKLQNVERSSAANLGFSRPAVVPTL